MKILHLISQRPEITGSGYYLQNILRLAKGAGHQNHLIAGIPEGNVPLLDCIDDSSCSFVTFSGGDLKFAIPGMSDVMPYESSRFRDLTPEDLNRYEAVFTAKVQELLSSFVPDVIHSHHLWLATSVAKRVARSGALHIPQVVSCHSTDLRQFRFCPHLQQRVLAGCQGVERVLALSRNQMDQIQDLYGIEKRRIDLVGSGFNDELFKYQKKGAPHPVQILYGGKISYAKGVDWLLRTLKRYDFPVHHHLVGSGAGEEEVHCLELAARLKERVTIHGRLSQVALARLMQRSHLFVLPSFYEGLPLVLLEALASGCRIVTTALPGCRELLGDTNNDLVEFVELPEMEEIDRPNPKDNAMLELRLSKAFDTRDSNHGAVPISLPHFPQEKELL